MRLGSANNEIYLKNKEIIEYEYRSCATTINAQFELKISMNFEYLDKDFIDYIKKWKNEDYKNENYYRELSLKVVFMKETIKEFLFSDAYIVSLVEKISYIRQDSLIYLDIKQKEDKFENISIFPVNILQKRHPSPISLEKLKLLDISESESDSYVYFDSDSDSDYDFIPEMRDYNLETENVKLFIKKLEKQENMPREYAQLLINKFSCASESAQNVFLKHVPDNSVDFIVFEKGQKTIYLWNEERIKMDISDEMSSDDKGAAYFHEHGHLIDFKEHVLSGNTRGIMSDDEIFINFLYEDYQNYIKTYADENNISISQTYFEITQILNQKKHAPVGDLYNYISWGLCKVKSGHSKEYWTQMPHRFEQEAVAHFFEAQFDAKKLKIIKHFFPKSTKRFDKTLQFIDKAYSIV